MTRKNNAHELELKISLLYGALDSGEISGLVFFDDFKLEWKTKADLESQIETLEKELRDTQGH